MDLFVVLLTCGAKELHAFLLELALQIFAAELQANFHLLDIFAIVGHLMKFIRKSSQIRQEYLLAIQLLLLC